MASTKAQAKPEYADGTEYRVKFMRRVDWRGAGLLPLHHHEMPGRVLNAIVEAEGADVVDSADAL